MLKYLAGVQKLQPRKHSLVSNNIGIRKGSERNKRNAGIPSGLTRTNHPMPQFTHSLCETISSICGEMLNDHKKHFHRFIIYIVESNQRNIQMPKFLDLLVSHSKYIFQWNSANTSLIRTLPDRRDPTLFKFLLEFGKIWEFHEHPLT